MDLAKVNAIVQWPEPCNVEELQIFLGMAGFYRHQYVCDYAKIACPMWDQSSGKGKFGAILKEDALDTQN